MTWWRRRISPAGPVNLLMKKKSVNIDLARPHRGLPLIWSPNTTGSHGMLHYETLQHQKKKNRSKSTEGQCLGLVPKASYQRGWLEIVAVSRSVKPLKPIALGPCEKFNWLYWFGSRRTRLPLACLVYRLCWESSWESTDRLELQQCLPSTLTIILGGFHLCDIGKLRNVTVQWPGRVPCKRKLS